MSRSHASSNEATVFKLRQSCHEHSLSGNFSPQLAFSEYSCAAPLLDACRKRRGSMYRTLRVDSSCGHSVRTRGNPHIPFLRTYLEITRGCSVCIQFRLEPLFSVRCGVTLSTGARVPVIDFACIFHLVLLPVSIALILVQTHYSPQQGQIVNYTGKLRCGSRRSRARTGPHHHHCTAEQDHSWRNDAREQQR